MRKLRPWDLEAAEALLLQCAGFVDKFRPVAQPLLNRAETEYHSLRRPSATARIRKMLAEHRAEDGK